MKFKEGQKVIWNSAIHEIAEILPEIGAARLKGFDKLVSMWQIEEPEYVYYYRKVGRTSETIPARVLERRGDRVKIHGNFPEGDREVWVKSCKCEPQENDD